LAAMAPVLFTPKGMVYGSDAAGPAVVLQARKPAALIVRGPAGEVYFARQLVAGEAYRAPIGQKLTAEVTDPAGFSVYINNQLRGALLVQKTVLDKVAVEIVNHSPAE
jgi:cytoskeleton protein RodZ